MMSYLVEYYMWQGLIDNHKKQLKYAFQNKTSL